MNSLYMRAFLCLAALPSCLIASHAEELKEITVTAKQIVNKADGQTYLPSSTIKKLAHDGLELLRLSNCRVYRSILSQEL